jgi:hypothetical protein
LSLIEERIHNLGFRTVLDFFEAHAGVPYGILLKKVAMPVEGTNHLDIPFFAILEIHRREAIRSGRVRDLAKDTLVRSLQEHLGKGWGKGKHSSTHRARAFSRWATPSDDVDRLCDDVWECLVRLKPPEDWRPADIHDEYIERAFDMAWPLGADEVAHPPLRGPEDENHDAIGEGNAR